MNRRERLLAGSIACLALIMALYFVWTSASAALHQRNSTLANLRKQLQEQERTLTKADRATRQLAELQRRSLPTDRELATSLYQQWLLNLIDRIGFVDPSVLVTDRRTRSGYFDQSRFEINAYATLDQLTEFLAAFYSSGDLHRIQLLSIKPVKDSHQLDLSIAVETISLPGAQRATVGDVASNRFAADELPALRRTVIDRSMFFPVNERPRLDSIGDQRVVKGTSLNVQAKATDPDPWDTLEFTLTGDSPKGVRLDKKGENEAELSWTPQETGDYTIEVSVRDNGSPQRDDKVTIHVAVVDPPPSDPDDGKRRVVGFDDATQTFLVGTVANGDQRQAWFNIRTKGQLLKLSRGDALDVGSIVGEIAQIDETHVEISTADGNLRIRVGQSLTEAVSTEPPDRQADTRS
jgi:hypothetical protein